MCVLTMHPTPTVNYRENDLRAYVITREVDCCNARPRSLHILARKQGDPRHSPLCHNTIEAEKRVHRVAKQTLDLFARQTR